MARFGAVFSLFTTRYFYRLATSTKARPPAATQDLSSRVPSTDSRFRAGKYYFLGIHFPPVSRQCFLCVQVGWSSVWAFSHPLYIIALCVGCCCLIFLLLSFAGERVHGREKIEQGHVQCKCKICLSCVSRCWCCWRWRRKRLGPPGVFWVFGSRDTFLVSGGMEGVQMRTLYVCE